MMRRRARCSSCGPDALIARDMDAAGIGFADPAEACGQRLIGEEMVAVAEVTTAHRGVAAELADIGDQERGPAVGGDGLAGLNFTEVEIQQCSVLVNAADA